MAISFPTDPTLTAARARAAAGAWRDVIALLAPAADERRSHAELAALYGEALMRIGRERDAIGWLRAAEPILAGSPDRAAHRRVVNLLGAACFALGELDAAMAAFTTALELATAEDDPLVMARASNNLGAIANLQGRAEAALWHYRLAIPAFQRVGEPRGLAEAYHNMAITHRDMGELEQADEFERRAEDYARRADAPRLAAMGRIGRAEVALRRGDAKLAEATALCAARDLAKLGDASNEADAHRLVGTACAAQRRVDEALEAYEQALALARSHGHALIEAETLRDRAFLHDRTGHPAEAAADARAALTIFRRLGAKPECEALERWLAGL